MKASDNKHNDFFEKDHQEILSDPSKTQENQSAVELVHSTILFAKDFAVEHPAFTIAVVGGLSIAASCLTLGIGLAVGAPFAIAAVTEITGVGSTAVSAIASTATTMHSIAATAAPATNTIAEVAHTGLELHSLFTDNDSSSPKQDNLLHTAATDDTELDTNIDSELDPSEDPDGPNLN